MNQNIVFQELKEFYISFQEMNNLSKVECFNKLDRIHHFICKANEESEKYEINFDDDIDEVEEILKDTIELKKNIRGNTLKLKVKDISVLLLANHICLLRMKLDAVKEVRDRLLDRIGQI